MRNSIKKIMVGVLMAACITGAATGCGTTSDKEKGTKTPAKITAVNKDGSGSGLAMDAMPPMFLNVDGVFYTFINFGSEYNIDQSLIGEKIGVIDKEIKLETQENVNANLAATYAVGGTVYKFTNHNQKFRVLVEKDGKYYIAENRSTLDGGKAVSKYFELAKLSEITEKIDIRDHFDRETFKSLEKEDALKMIEELTKSTWVKIDSELFEKVGGAQNDGKSFMLAVHLGDGTTLDMYVIPELKIFSVANETYKVSDEFINTFGELFEGIKQQPALIY